MRLKKPAFPQQTGCSPEYNPAQQPEISAILNLTQNNNK